MPPRCRRKDRNRQSPASRPAQLNAIPGLFRVVDGLYQVRGFALANMTIVEGRTGLIVVDPLSAVGSAEEALALYFAHRPTRPVVAVIYMGGSAGIITRAREDFRQGQFRWVVQVMNQVVYAEPGNTEARALAADAFEQLGYLTESATWRDAYLLGAQELRNGVAPGRRRQALDAEMIVALPAAMVFDYLGTTLNGPRSEQAKMVLNWRLTDTGESLTSTLNHAALTCVAGKTAADAEAGVTTTRQVFNAIVLRETTFDEAARRGQLTLTGNAARFTELMSYFDDFDTAFRIVEPRTP